MTSGIRLDLRRAWRGLVRSPVLSAAAALCLGLGLGPTIAIFTAVHAALLRPLPFPEPERLVTVFRTTPHFQSGPFSPANYLDLRTESSSGASSFPLVVRVSGEPSTYARRLAAAIRSIEPAAAISDVRSMETVIAESMGRPRFYLVLLGVFAVVALLLAAAGLYGVMSYAVEQRRREIGIRSALGSTPAGTTRLLLRQGAAMIAVGGAAGLLVGGATTRLLTGMLYGVSPLDATTWVSAASVLAIVGLLAVLVPARRAGRTDPVIAIRSD
ncbi:MAG: FtsX-like permease family protein [Gemmatimonadota bacterium]